MSALSLGLLIGVFVSPSLSSSHQLLWLRNLPVRLQTEIVMGTSRRGYELSWVRVVLGTICLGYELSWVRVVHFCHLSHMVFLKLFLRLPVVLSSSPLKILEGFCCGIHSNRIHVIRNDLICFIEEGLFCLYNGRKTDKIWNYIFQRGQSSMVAIGPGRLCLVKIYIYEKTTFWLKMIWHKIGPSKNCHISPSYTIGHGVSNDAKYSVVYSSHLSMMGTRSWCVTL